MKKYHIMVNLVFGCGDTLDYIVCAESEQDALEFVKKDILENTYSVKDSQIDEVELWKGRLSQAKKDFLKNKDKENSLSFNSMDKYVISDGDDTINFGWKDLDERWDYFENIFMKNAEKGTYIYAFENGGTRCDEIEGEGIFNKIYVYRGC